MARPLAWPFVRIALVAVGIVAVLAVLRPWTVRPLQVAKPHAFDPAAYARQVWPRIFDEATRTAVDPHDAAVLQGSSQTVSPARATFVQATGTVTSIDRRSRVGLALVQLTGGPGDVAVQIGPVIRGTALRDAAGFIRFNDFTNQIEFGAVSNALHDRVLADVVGRIDVDALDGQVVTVLGATKLPPPGGRVEIVPLQITVKEGAR